MRRAAIAFFVACLQTGVASATVVLPRLIHAGSFDRCPGGQQWLQSRRDERRAGDQLAAPSDTALRSELLALSRTQAGSDGAMAAADAAADAAAMAADAAADVTDAAGDLDAETAVVSPAAAGVARLQAIVAHYGMPSVGEVGDDGMRAFIDLLDEARSQPQFLMRAAEEILRIPDPRLDRALKRRLAELVDRSLDDAGKPQRYGTLFEFNPQRTVVVRRPSENAATLAARRAEAGLIPIALELCVRRDSESPDFWPPFF